MGTRPYIVKQGDYLLKLAHRMGFDADAVWMHDTNRELRERRPNPNLLAPGDKLHVPDEPEPCELPLVDGEENRYKGKIPGVTVAAVFCDGGVPLKNAPYVAYGLGGRLLGASDNEGGVSFKVSIHVREVRIVFYERALSYRLLVGDLDPIEETSGVTQRLTHMAFGRWIFTDDASATPYPARGSNALAIRAFQRANKLEETGIADDATREALRRVHGG